MPKDRDPVAELQCLADLGQRDNDRAAVGDKVAQQIVDLALGADVDPVGRLLDCEDS